MTSKKKLSRKKIRDALAALARGDTSARLPLEGADVDREIAMSFNVAAERAANLAADAHLVKELSRVTTAVARGDVGQKLEVEVTGETRQLKNTVNAMVDQLGTFAVEVTRIAREVGVDGVLGGEIRLSGALGVWKTIVDEMNALSRNMATQVRAVARVVDALARGDFDKRVEAEARGEIAELFGSIDTAMQNQAEATRKLAAASRYKSQFLANMSHELRTPLNSLLILARQLTDNQHGHLDEREVRYARTILGAGSDLLELINEILDLAKIESGTMTVQPTDVSIETLCEHLEATFHHVAEDRALAFTIARGEGVPAWIVTDELRIKQILRNLLSNAFKFTPSGSVSLAIESTSGSITFAVRDSGIGIPSAQQALVFEAFQQADGTTTRKHGGTGLGLAISRELARVLGGDVRLESVVGIGSTFTLRLPCTVAAPRPAPIAVPVVREMVAAAPVAVAGRRVLVVDDDVRNTFALSAALESHGLEVVYADSGAEALERIDPSVELVLMDVMMPEMDGYEATRRIRARTDVARVPIIMLTAKAMPDDREKCLQAGASDYVTKPVEVDRLIALIGAWMGGAGVSAAS